MYIFNILSLIYFYPVGWKISNWVVDYYVATEGPVGAAIFFFYGFTFFNSIALLWGKTKWSQLIVWVIVFHWFWGMGWL